MVSPAKAHFLRASAAALGVQSPAVRQDATQYELMLAKLAEDRRRLKDIQSFERKAAVKRELLPEYRPWVEGVLQGNSGLQDDVLMTVMVWTIDVGDLASAIEIGRYALDHQLTLPDQYQRNTATLIAEECADQALKALAADEPADIAALQAVLALTAEEDMHDAVRAKLHKAIGYALRDEAEDCAPERRHGSYEQARQHLIRALELYDKVGVKKDIERLETALKNLAPAPALAGGAG